MWTPQTLYMHIGLFIPTEYITALSTAHSTDFAYKKTHVSCSAATKAHNITDTPTCHTDRPSTTHALHSSSMHTIQTQFGLEGGGSNKGSLSWAPSVRGPLNSAELIQMHIFLVVSDCKGTLYGALASSGLCGSHIRCIEVCIPEVSLFNTFLLSYVTWQKMLLPCLKNSEHIHARICHITWLTTVSSLTILSQLSDPLGCHPLAYTVVLLWELPPTSLCRRVSISELPSSKNLAHVWSTKTTLCGYQRVLMNFLWHLPVLEN